MSGSNVYGLAYGAGRIQVSSDGGAVGVVVRSDVGWVAVVVDEWGQPVRVLGVFDDEHVAVGRVVDDHAGGVAR